MMYNFKTWIHRTRGGATFTLLIFVLLLISTGLMYYYFHRCHVLEGELSKWKTGLKEREVVTTATPTPKPAAQKRGSLRDFAASLGTRLTGTPATEPAKKATLSPTPQESKSSKAMAGAQPDHAKPSSPEKQPQRASDENELPAPQVHPSTTPTPTPRVSNRQGKSTNTSARSTSAAAVSKPESAKPRSTPIGSMYDVQADAESDSSTADEPAVRVRAPKRTAAPSRKIDLDEQ